VHELEKNYPRHQGLKHAVDKLTKRISAVYKCTIPQ